MTTILLPRQPHSEFLAKLRTIGLGLGARGAVGLGLAAKAGGAAGNGLLNSLVAYWPLNEASGNLLDAHTNALHLTDNNTVTNAAGKVYTTARQYTRANSEYHARPGDDALLSTGDMDFTLAAWIYLDSKPPEIMAIASKDTTAAGGREYLFFWSNTLDRFRWAVLDGTTSIGSISATALGAPSLGTWYYVTVWHDSVANTNNIQVNNGTVDSAATIGAPSDTTSVFAIGATTGIGLGSFWNGRIGPVAMWKSAAGAGGVLDATKRAALWNGGNGLAYSAFTA